MKTVLKMMKIKKDNELFGKAKHCYDITNGEKSRFIKERKFYLKEPFHTLKGNKFKAREDVNNLIDKRIKDKDKDLRKGAIKCFEFVFSLSPEFFDNNDKFDIKKINEFVKRTKKFIKEELEYENVAHMVLHLHEETPHIHMFYVPFVETDKRGRHKSEKYTTIRSRDFNQIKYSKLQNMYFKNFESLGFEKPTPKTTKGKDNKELKEHYMEVIEENENKNKIFNEKIESLEIKNNILVKELNEAKTELERTKQELSKLQKVIELVKNFFNVDKMKELIEKIRPEQKEEKKSMISYDEAEEKIKTSLKPKPEPASARFRKKRKF